MRTIKAILRFVANDIVADVPPSIDECESCRETDCAQERFASCERRL